MRAPLGWAAIREAAAASELRIDSSTGQCRWDGEPAHYEWIVDRLAHAEYRCARA